MNRDTKNNTSLIVVNLVVPVNCDPICYMIISFAASEIPLIAICIATFSQCLTILVISIIASAPNIMNV